MTECECIPGCPFFNDKMAKMPAMAHVYKTNYCQSDFDSCARHRVLTALGKPAVPSDLYPNQEDRALEIIAAAKQ